MKFLMDRWYAVIGVTVLVVFVVLMVTGVIQP